MLLVWGNLQWGFRDVGCCSSIIVVLNSLMSLHFRATSPCNRHSGTVKGSTSSELYPGYFRLFLPFHQPRTLQFWVGIFTCRRFLPYAPSPTFLILPAFIKAFLGAGSSSLKSAGLHADPQNTDPAHLFVWFTAIHNHHIQKNSFLNHVQV